MPLNCPLLMGSKNKSELPIVAQFHRNTEVKTHITNGLVMRCVSLSIKSVCLLSRGVGAGFYAFRYASFCHNAYFGFMGLLQFLFSLLLASRSQQSLATLLTSSALSCEQSSHRGPQERFLIIHRRAAQKTETTQRGKQIGHISAPCCSSG